MATLVLPRPLRGEATRRRLTDVTAAIAVAATAALSTYFVDHWGIRRGVTAGAVLLVLLWMATTRRTLVALAVLMVYLGTLDGYLKLSTGAGAVTLVRDALVFALVVGLLVRAAATGQRLPMPPLSIVVLGFVVLVFVQFLNPLAGTPSHSLAGARQHLEFVPLFFLTFAFVRTTRALRGFVILLLVIGAANGIANWEQFRLTPDQFAAWGPGYAERVLGQGKFVDAGRTFASQADTNGTRPFGLMSDSGGGGIMGAFALGGALALASMHRRLRYLVFAAVAAIASTVGIVTSQARVAVVGGVFVVLAYGLLTAVSNRRLANVLGIAVAGTLALVVFQGVVGSVGSSNLRYQGVFSSRIIETTQQARGGSIQAIPGVIAEFPLGAGLGTAGPAAGQPGANQYANVVDTESWFSFMTVETGIVGMVLMTAFTIMLFALGVSRVRLEPDAETRTLLAAIIAPIAALFAFYFVGGGATATMPGGPYLWAVGGIVSYWLIARPAELRRAAG